MMVRWEISIFLGMGLVWQLHSCTVAQSTGVIIPRCDQVFGLSLPAGTGDIKPMNGRLFSEPGELTTGQAMFMGLPFDRMGGCCGILGGGPGGNPSVNPVVDHSIELDPGRGQTNLEKTQPRSCLYLTSRFAGVLPSSWRGLIGKRNFDGP